MQPLVELTAERSNEPRAAVTESQKTTGVSAPFGGKAAHFVLAPSPSEATLRPSGTTGYRERIAAPTSSFKCDTLMSFARMRPSFPMRKWRATP